MTFAVRTLFSSGASPAGAPTNAYNGAEASRFSGTGGAFTTEIIFDTDGNVRSFGTLGSSTNLDSGLPSTWFFPSTPGIGTSYWVRATHVSGDTFTLGTVGSWQQLSSNRTWGMHVASGGFRSGTYTFEVASDSGGVTVVATGNITVTADSGL